MNPVYESTLDIQDVPRLFAKYWPSMLLATLISTTVFVAAGNHLPKKYKAHFVLTIYSKYFQSPLIGDFVPGLSESGEMRSQRESLIRQVLTPEYLDSLGQKYGIYGAGHKSAVASWSSTLRELGEAVGFYEPTSKDSVLSGERESLRSRIEINSLNNTTFNVGFVYSDPNVTLQVTQDIYAQIIQSLLEIRMHILANVRDAIHNRLGSLSATAASSAIVSPAGPSEQQSIEDELKEVRSQLRALTSQYTEEHPLVVQMRDRERILVSRLANAPPSSRASRRDTSALAPGSGEAGRDMYGDLMKKLNYLDIAMDSDRQHQSDYFAMLETPLYPSAPLWPKKGLLAIWGFALGLFGSLFIAALREYFQRSTLHAEALAHQLSIPVLGGLPRFPSKAQARVTPRLSNR